MRLGRLASIAAIALLCRSADAHQFEHPKTLRMGIKRDRLLVSVAYDVNPGEESKRTRSVFDRDGDGQLDPAEQDRLAHYLEETATLWMRVLVDDRPCKLDKVEMSPNRLNAPRDSTDSLGISILYSAPLPEADRVRIEVIDRDKDKAKHVPLIVDLSPDWDVVLATQGELHPAARQLSRIALGQDASVVLLLRRSLKGTP
jgi:hypothetical protein